MKKNAFDPVRVRIWALTGLMGLCLVAFAGVMYYTQILHGEENRAKSLASNAASETVEASRGIITDRNGKVLVSNRLTYTLIFSAKEFDTDQELNAAILRLTDLCTENGTAWNDTLPVSRTAPYSYTDPADGEGFALFLKNKDIPYSTLSQVTPTLQPDRFMAKLRQLFNIDDSYTEDQARTIARVYNTEYAAHVLGRLSPIYYEDWVGDPKNGITGYRDMEGYSMNSLVGREGAEKAFESYLHGTKGTRIITTNQEGKITGELYTKEPQPGGTVALTLDIDLQEDTEKSLAQTIQAMTQKDGVVRGGAAVVVGVGSGEVLAMASYPTYNLSTFDQDYSKLVSDTAGTPLLNRAIGGAYAPGSTFKPCTAVAALESGIITPSSTIVDRGVYDYYKSPQPRCWIYNEYGGTHGRVNVSQAITVSCNYFFYEVGRLTGIKTLASYAKQFGLGEYTGIEIGGPGSAEAKGSMATPEFAEAEHLEWTDGQTLTAAIGQSYDLFTPLQLANYIATLVGNGQHYEAHLLKNVKSYDNSSVIYAYDKEPLNTVQMSDSTVRAVKEGMHNLTTGSLSYYFSKCVVSAGAKTGTAETGINNTNNGVFVCFAPYDDPQIAVAVVIEKGGSGAALASTAVDIVNSYFSQEEIGAVIIGENTLLK